MIKIEHLMLNLEKEIRRHNFVILIFMGEEVRVGKNELIKLVGKIDLKKIKVFVANGMIFIEEAKND